MKWTSHGSHRAGIKRKQVRKKAQGSPKAGEIKMIFVASHSEELTGKVSTCQGHETEVEGE